MPFQVANTDWILTQTGDDTYSHASRDGNYSISGITGAELVSANAVIAELDRFLAGT